MEYLKNKQAIYVEKTIYRKTRASLIRGRLVSCRWLYFMLLPGVLFFIIFKYGPMLGLVIAFEDYQPYLGFLRSKWVGIAHFQRLFSEYAFVRLLRNTVILGVCNIVFFFPVPVVVSLMLNEVRAVFCKRFVQTVIYIPHFLSWVVIASITYTFFTIEGGVVNNVLVSMGMDKINPLLSASWFRPMIVLQLIWKESGWGTIIILAAITGINPDIYFSAEIDGAGRWQKLWHITLPSIRSTIVILLILRLSSFMEFGFEQVFLMMNAVNTEVGDIFDTYVYRTGIMGGQFSYTAAVGMFKSVVSLFLVFIANSLSKRFGEEGIF